MASFFVTARTSSKHSISPDYYVHDNTVELIERALGMSIEDFCVKFDAYSILGLRGTCATISLTTQPLYTLVRIGKK